SSARAVATPCNIRAAMSQPGPMVARNSPLAPHFEDERRADHRTPADIIGQRPATIRADSSDSAYTPKISVNSIGDKCHCSWESR
ncbi:hypothetical protein SB778_40400, partial [Paraburkholderia sp. SIMBA_050]